MPTYDWKCESCGETTEWACRMSQTTTMCPYCIEGLMRRQFSPNKNILIPGHFRMDRGWHLPPEGSSASSADLNNRVQQKPRESFGQQFDKHWAKAGGS